MVLNPLRVHPYGFYVEVYMVYDLSAPKRRLFQLLGRHLQDALQSFQQHANERKEVSCYQEFAPCLLV